MFSHLNLNLDNTLLLVFCFACFFLLIQIIYNLYFFRKIIVFKYKKSDYKPNISVIICAKNEFNNLKNNLPSFLTQNYINFEVVVVNDQSNDRTSELLNEFKKTYSRLTVVDINENVNHVVGKKFALTLGIKTAKYENLLLTDADCYATTNNWISSMAQNFNHSDIILGYGSYKKEKGLLNKLIRFDTYNVAIQYLSYALNNLTYMGVGRNLSYRKSLFFKNKGFANHLHIASGDDDLFIREVAENNNVSIELSSDSHTLSFAKKTWKEWFHQKNRHLTTSPMYDRKIQYLLSLLPFSQVLFIASLVFLIYCEVSYVYWGSLIVIKLFLGYLINYPLMKRFNVTDLYLLQPFYELFHLFFYGILFLFSINTSNNKWKS